MTNPLDSVDHEHGVLQGIHPDSADYSDYDYQYTDETIETEPGRLTKLPLSEADKKMEAILKDLPMITTKRPVHSMKSDPKHRPRAHFGHVMNKHHSGTQGLLVHSDMDIVDQTNLFSKLDPFHIQFIPAPQQNAGNNIEF